MEKHCEPSTRSCIVVVDDDAAVRNSLKFSLEVEGFAVRAFADGTELLNAGVPPDCTCMVFDQNMPGMTGLELVAKLRDRGVLAPAILITSHPNAALSKRAMSAGIPIIEKPLFGSNLVEAIRAAVARNSR